MTMPYTYIVKNLSTGKIYYGCQYSKNCHPDNLWKTYFTSSKYVRELIEQHGKNDFIYEVRKTFKTKNSALNWERKVLRRLNASFSETFLNRNNGGLTTYAKHRWIKKGDRTLFVDEYRIEDYLNAGWILGRHFNTELRNRISDSKRGQPSPHKGKKLSAEQREQCRKNAMGGKSKSLECTIGGTTYPSMKAAMKDLNLSRYHIRKIIRNN